MTAPRGPRTAQEEIEIFERKSAAAKRAWADPATRTRHIEERARRDITKQPAWKGESAGYDAVHIRARKALQGQTACALVDDTCKGKLDVALRHDAPQDLIRIEEGRPYYVGIDFGAAYFKLCRSHHLRYDRYGL